MKVPVTPLNTDALTKIDKSELTQFDEKQFDEIAERARKALGSKPIIPGSKPIKQINIAPAHVKELSSEPFIQEIVADFLKNGDIESVKQILMRQDLSTLDTHRDAILIAMKYAFTNYMPKTSFKKAIKSIFWAPENPHCKVFNSRIGVHEKYMIFMDILHKEIMMPKRQQLHNEKLDEVYRNAFAGGRERIAKKVIETISSIVKEARKAGKSDEQIKKVLATFPNHMIDTIMLSMNLQEAAFKGNPIDILLQKFDIEKVKTNALRANNTNKKKK
ncbi:MAG: hypothetical protein FWE50_01095 [Alphaproteobacteria bacterium]|nr:hypothetical protein [Alphaproteobacteria bacterium]